MTKRYQVEITKLAENDILAIRQFIALDKSQAAARWVREIKRQARSLSRFPDRHEVIPEVVECGIQYRHILHGDYRTLYRIEGERVVIVRVVHGARIVDRSFLFGSER